MLAASGMPVRTRAEEPADHHGAAPQRSAAPRPSAAPWLTLPPTPKLPEAARSGLVDANGVRLFYAQFGAGPPVVMLHGGLANSNYWGGQVEALAKSYTVTVTDTRGHGRSPLMAGAFGYDVFARDVAALMDALHIPSAALVGWSDGAITGLQLAMTQPARVLRLFAFGANASVDGLKPDGARSAVFSAFAARCRAEYAALSPHPERWPQLLAGLRPMWRTQPSFTRTQLASVRCPTAISDGEYDEIIKREHTMGMSQAIPGALLLIQPRVSHFAMLQNTEQFNRTLTDFLTA